MSIIKLSFENEYGKYDLFITNENLKDIIDNTELFQTKFVDAKTGEAIFHKENIKSALNIETDKQISQ